MMATAYIKTNSEISEHIRVTTKYLAAVLHKEFGRHYLVVMKSPFFGDNFPDEPLPYFEVTALRGAGQVRLCNPRVMGYHVHSNRFVKHMETRLIRNLKVFYGRRDK